MINEDKIRKVYSSDRGRGFRLLVDSFQEPIYNYIQRMVMPHEDAEDVLQEVFIRVFRYLDRFRNKSSLDTWIYGTVANKCLRLLNSRREEVTSAEDARKELMSKLKTFNYVNYKDELAVKLQETMLTLPKKQQIVSSLHYYDELEYEDVTRVLDSRVETLKANYHYARDKIKEYILNR